MHKLPSLTSQEVVRILERKGYVLEELREAIEYIIIRKVKEELLSLTTGKIYQSNCSSHLTSSILYFFSLLATVFYCISLILYFLLTVNCKPKTKNCSSLDISSPNIL